MSVENKREKITRPKLEITKLKPIKRYVQSLREGALDDFDVLRRAMRDLKRNKSKKLTRGLTRKVSKAKKKYLTSTKDLEDQHKALEIIKKTTKF